MTNSDQNKTADTSSESRLPRDTSPSNNSSSLPIGKNIRNILDSFGSKMEDNTNTTLNQSDENVRTDSTTDVTTTIGEDIYKMKSHGLRGFDRSPTRIEFELFRKSNIPKKKRKCVFFCNKKNLTNHHHHQCHECCKKRSQLYENNRKGLLVTKSNLDEKPSTYKNLTKASEQITSKVKQTFSGIKTPIKVSIENVPVTKNKLFTRKKQRVIGIAEENCENIDIYYFDHGNSAYFRTTDCPPQLVSELLAQKTMSYATRFWAEIFGTIHIGVAFFIAFILQAYRFILYSIIRPLIVGFLQMTSDYFIKPALTIIFNGVLQPPMILLYNIFSSICDMCEPIGKTLGHFLRPIAAVLKQIRCIEINRYKTFQKRDDKEMV